ncbi:MAG: transglycosylase domain-containing protein [Alphaproteobacteria bacterium]
MIWAQRIKRALIYGFLALGIVWAALFLILAPALPDLSDLRTMRKSPGITIVAGDGSVLERRGAFNGVFVPLRDLPPQLAEAVIATEDRRFYQHFGMDLIGFTRAVVANLTAGRIVQGGSTITQQLAKNVYLTPERTVLRKLRELMLAVWLEARLDKDEILSAYLNRVYLGDGTFGVEAAAQRYFGKSARNLSLSEAAVLAGLLKAPTRYAPTNDLARSRARAAQVLQNMVEAGYITEAQAKAAERSPAVPVKTAQGPRRARYFVDWVNELMPEWASRTQDDLVVFTTLDPEMQRQAEAAVGSALRRYAEARNAHQAALIAFDSFGAVKAMVGGRSYAESQFNRAVQARRQPGSAFKPFVYLAALEQGLTPATRIEDSPVSVDGWKPQNVNGRYQGEVTLKRALAESINTVAVKLSERVGRDKVRETARRLGIASPISAHPSLALGTSEVSLFELTAAYLPLANGGRGVVPYAVTEIRTRSGQVVYRRQQWPDDRIVAPQNTDRMNDMLAEVIDSGTGKAARLGNRPAAGKTGTTQDFRDGWFVGYTADLVTGVWLGNDDNSPMRNVGGGDIPARTWRQFMMEASRGMPVRPLRDADDGTLIAAGEIFERVASWFRALTGQSDDRPSTEAEAQQRRVVRQVEDWLRRHSGGTPPPSSRPQGDVE